MIILVILITGLFTLSAEINDPVLAISVDVGQYLVYDQDKGIVYADEGIYLTCYRTSSDTVINTFYLICLHSQNNGADYEETVIAEFDLNFDDYLLLLSRRYAPTIARTEDGSLHIFYTDPVITLPSVAISADNGETFNISLIDGLSPHCQYQLIKNAEGIQFAAIEDETTFPLSFFEEFTNSFYSENDEYSLTDGTIYWGPDIFQGNIHSNGDIWIYQAGGGNNNNWPTFNQMVTTSGRIMDWATRQPAEQSAPMEQIFLGGYSEDTIILELPSEATAVRENGLFLGESSEHDILYVQLDGTTAHLRYADWITYPDTFIVYNTFPDEVHTEFPIGDSIWENQIEVKELVWAEETTALEVINSSVFVDCELWIEGSVGSNMTWASAGTSYITGDICYADIKPGDPAEESSYLFGLISEERILIK
jgi:hypothetical protein